MSRWIQPVTLKGEHVALEPLTADHTPSLAAAASDGELWKLWYTSVPAPGEEAAYVAAALAMGEHEGALPFVVRDARSGDVVGTTRYLNVDEKHHRLEIGATWYAKRMQRTPLNTEAKLLLLTHAFEKLDAIAVEFRTHFMNHASRAAIARLGAKQDGILRSHQISRDGTLRDTVVFSIIASEWPSVRSNLNFKLAR
jgi:N-acetyltransferase